MIAPNTTHERTTNIELRTNDPGTVLNLQSIECCDGDFTCKVMIRSGGFSADHRFDFGGDSLPAFYADLQKMNSNLTGSAQLKYRYEEDELNFRVDGLGHVIVNGLLVEYGPPQQELRFAFSTDQTCLAPLLSDLKGLLARHRMG